MLKVADIGRITALARRHGALTLLDNTLAGPHSHGALDLDLYVHSLTKYVSGHGDVMGGAIIGRAELIHSMRPDLTVLGPTLDPHAAFLMLRGLRTYFVRRDAQCRSAARVADFLGQHPAVERVRYPGLTDDPGHERAARQMEDFGTVVSFDIAGGLAAGTRFADALDAVCDRREPGIDRIAGRRAVDAAAARPDGRAARLVGDHAGDRAAIGRRRGRRRPYRRHRTGTGTQSDLTGARCAL